MQPPGRIVRTLVANELARSGRRLARLADDIGIAPEHTEHILKQQALWRVLERVREWAEGLLRLESGSLAPAPPHTEARIGEQLDRALVAAGVRSERGRRKLGGEMSGVVNSVVDAGTGKFQKLFLEGDPHP